MALSRDQGSQMNRKRSRISADLETYRFYGNQ